MRYYLYLMLSLLYSCNSSTEKKIQTTIKTSSLIKLSGSTTIGSFMSELENHNLNSIEFCRFEIIQNGSNEGFADLMKNENDIAMMSNELSNYFEESLSSNNIQIVEQPIAIDAIVFIVNKKNIIKKLSFSQIQKIFTGKIKNWKEVGGHNCPINVLSRDNSSGTYSYILSNVLNDVSFVNTTKFCKNNSEILEGIKKDSNSISYSSKMHCEDVSNISIRFDSSGIFINPSKENTINHKYRLQRTLYLYYRKEKETKIKEFIVFVKNGGLTKFIDKAGYIPYSLVKHETID